MKVLVIGGGGREHALAWKAAQSPNVDIVYVAPGNAGTATEAGLENINIAAEDLPDLLDFAQQNHIDLSIVGPEVPLVAGVVDLFQAQGMKCFGPGKAASQLEGSKTFCKDFLARHQIPTAAYEVFTEIEPAVAYIKQQGTPIVVKADGLAAGKGVILAETEQRAINAVSDMLAGNAFGNAGHRVVVEEFLQGEEASFIVMADGQHVLPMATSQDHKARDNGDKGPNTGGMGAYSPAPVVTDAIYQQVMKTVIMPTIEGMAKDGMPYTGFLYAGLMIDNNGQAKVLEYNCRFGDPETQPIMLRLQSDLPALCLAALAGQLDQHQTHWDPRPAVGVVLAAGGYPNAYNKGDVISGLDQTLMDSKIFHAGTQLKDGKTITHGGRVLCATALGECVADAQQKAYQIARNIHWNNVYFRTDIGYRAIERENAAK